MYNDRYLILNQKMELIAIDTSFQGNSSASVLWWSKLHTLCVCVCGGGE